MIRFIKEIREEDFEPGSSPADLSGTMVPSTTPTFFATPASPPDSNLEETCASLFEEWQAQIAKWIPILDSQLDCDAGPESYSSNCTWIRNQWLFYQNIVATSPGLENNPTRCDDETEHPVEALMEAVRGVFVKTVLIAT